MSYGINRSQWGNPCYKISTVSRQTTFIKIIADLDLRLHEIIELNSMYDTCNSDIYILAKWVLNNFGDYMVAHAVFDKHVCAFIVVLDIYDR